MKKSSSGLSAVFSFSFGPFRLFPARQLLLEDDKPVRLGSRALDILTALVERAGKLVGKDELIARVWPTLSSTRVISESISLDYAGLWARAKRAIVTWLIFPAGAIAL